MAEKFSAEHAERLIGHCQNVDQARYLIENSAVLGPIHQILSEPDAKQCSENELLRRYCQATGEKKYLDEFRHYLDWFRDVGLWSW